MNDELATAKRPHVVIRTLRAVAQPIAHRYDRHYHPRHRHGHIHFILDTTMVIVIVLMTSLLVGLYRLDRSSAPLTPPPHPSTTPASLTATATVRVATLEGEPLWAGPLPPVVGRETRLRVFFDIAGIGVTERNLTLTAAVVPPAVLTGQASANHGSLTMTDGHIRWDIGAQSPGTANAQASIEVALTPTPDDVGKALPLLTAATLTGEDAAAQKPITMTLPAVSTAALPNNLGVITK